MNIIETLQYRLNTDLFFFSLTALLLFVFFVALVKLLWRSQSALSYFALPTLFSPGELSFYYVLKQALSGEYEIFAKVRIADVIRPEKSLNQKLYRTALNKITSKHFDYVICDPKTLSIVAAIELDDKSHSTTRVIVRDNFVNGACKSAGIKLIRFKAKSRYQIQHVRDVINTEINSVQ